MSEDDKGIYFQQGDWLRYWTTAVQDWQRAYVWAIDGFTQRAEQMAGLRGGPTWRPEDLMHLWSRMAESWTRGMGMPGAMNLPTGAAPMDTPDASRRSEIMSCAVQAYLASMANLMRWWMRMAQSWGEYGRNTAAAVGTSTPDGSTLGVLADQTRAQMRKVAEISLEECTLLQRQMEGLAEKIREAFEGSSADAQPRRYARAKE